MWPVPLAQVCTHYKIGKLNLWTLFCNVCIEILNSQIWKEIMFELNGKPSGKPSSVTTFSTDFSFQNLVFGIYLNFQLQISFKNQYFSHSESKFYQINSIKSCSSRSFQQHQRHVTIPPKFLATILFYFQWKNHSIFKNFCTGSPNVMAKPMHPPHRELSKDTKNMIWSIHNY